MKFKLNANKINSCLLGTSLALFSQLASADVILHAFDWKYSEVAAKAAEIAEIGYKEVLVAPPLKSDSNNSQWWARYQPQDLRVIDNNRGNKEDFQNMINALNAHGVKTYADIVINQTANERGNSTYFPGADTINDYMNNSGYWEKQKLFGDLSNNLYTPGDFHAEFCISDWTSVWESMNGRICGGNGDRGLPDLDPNDWVRAQQRSYLQAIKNMGVKGFRIDAAKHMTTWHINQVFTDSIKQDMYLFAEIITGAGSGNIDYDTFLEPYLRETTHSAYDFPLLKTLRDAFSSNGSLTALANPKSWGGAIDGMRALTFTITHDIPSNDGFRYQIMSETNEHLAYAYILGRQEGVPMVFSDATGVDNGRWVNDYKQDNLKAMVKFHNSVQGADEEVLYSDQCALVFRRGQAGLVGINKCGYNKDINIDASGLKQSASYADVFTGASFEVNSNSYTINIPASSARMWLADGEVVIINPTNVDVNFTCNNGYTNMGDSVYAVGDQAELGNWQAASAVKLNPASYPVWTGSISLPANTNIAWKCIIRNETNPSNVIQWQSGADNTVNTGTGASTTGGF
ncbi:carbohydrate-binding module family 20 domain-containing protein [Psychromonas antarctica]|uniref:carbohydrate-binding module family 20 domain-containing protein n=1 Tax=Psychromonas antarctica TaxID=67573 RepID=UPI001EE8EC60|nr:carbohydrate-binding module family 20 domain-containing protein [Psychromonas antarctica]MCG6201272.1 alpha-amylase [Psychromonas antarctica]